VDQGIWNCEMRWFHESGPARTGPDRTGPAVYWSSHRDVPVVVRPRSPPASDHSPITLTASFAVENGSWRHLGGSCRRVNLYFRSVGDCLITQRERDGLSSVGRRSTTAGPGRRRRRLIAWAIMLGHYVGRESHSFSVVEEGVMDRWIQLQVIDSDVTAALDTLTSLPLFSSDTHGCVADSA